MKKQQFITPYLLLIFSPFLFAFQFNSFDEQISQGGYFKESIYCCILSFIGWASVHYEAKTFERLFYVTLLLYPMVILTQEMFAICLPILLIIYLIKIELNAKRFAILSVLVTCSIITFMMCLNYHGDRAQVIAIAQSLALKYPVSTYGSIGWLAMTREDAVGRVLIQINYNHYFKNYSLVILLCAISFIPLRQQLKIIFNNKLRCLLLLITLFGTLCICYVAIDWGRFIRIIAISVSILCLVVNSTQNLTLLRNNSLRHKGSTIALIVITLLYASLWRIPNCCNYRPIVSGLENNNFSWSYQPYKKIWKSAIDAINKI